MCLITGDFDFADVRNYPPRQYAGLVVLSVPRGATADFILNLLQDFLKEDTLIPTLSGKLAIVEPGRIRIRTG
jgi:hypothetical protein